MVVLTSLSESELGHDVMARLAGRRLYRADAWEAAMARFGAHSVDPRIAREGWIADLLLELPGGDFPTVPSGYLDAGTVWQTLLGRRLGLTDSRPDALALLRWIATPASVERYIAADEKLRVGFKQWLTLSVAGEAAVAIADCLEATRNTDAIAIGLVFDVLTASAPATASSLRICAARLERMHGNRPLGESAARAWPVHRANSSTAPYATGMPMRSEPGSSEPTSFSKRSARAHMPASAIRRRLASNRGLIDTPPRSRRYSMARAFPVPMPQRNQRCGIGKLCGRRLLP